MSSTDTTISWRALVEELDGPTRHVNDLYPIVYVFSNNAFRRDSGPTGGVYEPQP